MSVQHTDTSTAPVLDRRDWLKQSATLAGASAAGVALAATGCAAGPSSPADDAAAAGAGTIETPDAAIVATGAGSIRGFTHNGVFVFKGIPYGATTAGENRFMPPKPVSPWTDVRPTIAWGPVSPHGLAPAGSMMIWDTDSQLLIDPDQEARRVLALT